MTPEERAKQLVGLFSGVGDCVDDSAKKIEALVAAEIRAALKEQRRELGERIKASALPNKDEVTAVVFPVSTPPVKREWVDLSKGKE